jgi:EAL domain-containing protein (putative c-di-GMP-specific phosphodiesterase class I)
VVPQEQTKFFLVAHIDSHLLKDREDQLQVIEFLQDLVILVAIDLVGTGVLAARLS